MNVNGNRIERINKKEKWREPEEYQEKKGKRRLVYGSEGMLEEKRKLQDKKS